MSNVQHMHTARAELPLNELRQNSMRFVCYILMTPEQWHDVPDNPRQRDTVGRARRSHHLRTPDPTHAKVTMARLPNGDTYKIDGHTRDYMWQEQQVPAPAMLTVDVWDCDTIQDVLTLYTRFDSDRAVERVTDKMYGAYREHSPDFRSPLLHAGHIATAMRVPYEMLRGLSHSHSRDVDVYTLLGYWMPELRLLDKTGPTKAKFPTGITSGALLTFRRYGPSIQEFWDRYQADDGAKIGSAHDAVFALEKRRMIAASKGALHGAANIMHFIGVCISAVEAHRKNKTYTAGIKATQDNALEQFLTRANATKRTWA